VIARSISAPEERDEEDIPNTLPVVREFAVIVWKVSVSEETVQALSSPSSKVKDWVPVGLVKEFQVTDPAPQAEPVAVITPELSRSQNWDLRSSRTLGWSVSSDCSGIYCEGR